MKICSILIPTRRRGVRLLHTINSIESTASVRNIEILLRVDSDDAQTINLLPHFMMGRPHLKAIIGPRLGYGRLHDYYNELCRISEATWFFVLNDDITLEGNGWEEKLKEIPTYKLVIPESYKLGGSTYTEFGCAHVCPIVGLTQLSAHGPMQAPVDDWWMNRIGGGMAYKTNTVIIPGLCVNHQRDDDQAIHDHRHDDDLKVEG